MGVIHMAFNKNITLSKGAKGFIVGFVAQLIPMIPDVCNKLITANWGDMTVKSAIIAVLVMLANYIKNKLIAEDTKINTAIKKLI